MQTFARLCNLFAYTHHKAHDYKCNLHKNLLFILMDIRLFCCRCFVFPGLWVGYEAKDGNQTTHQRTDDVEEAEGEIDKLVFHLLCVFIRLTQVS